METYLLLMREWSGKFGRNANASIWIFSEENISKYLKKFIREKLKTSEKVQWLTYANESSEFCTEGVAIGIFDTMAKAVHEGVSATTFEKISILINSEELVTIETDSLGGYSVIIKEEKEITSQRVIMKSQKYTNYGLCPNGCFMPDEGNFDSLEAAVQEQKRYALCFCFDASVHSRPVDQKR